MQIHGSDVVVVSEPLHHAGAPPPRQGAAPPPMPETKGLRRVVTTRSRNPLVMLGSWLVGELFLALDNWARWFLSSLVYFAVKWLLSHWFIPEELWQQGPELARGFDGARDVTPPQQPQQAQAGAATATTAGSSRTVVRNGRQRMLADPPNARFLFAIDEGGGDNYKFYDHQTRYFGQVFPCPLLYAEPCQACEWFVMPAPNTPMCVARTLVRVHDEPYFMFHNLSQVKAEILHALQGEPPP